MLLYCAFTFFINYIVVLNTTINSALTQAICGNLKVSFSHHFSLPWRTMLLCSLKLGNQSSPLRENLTIIPDLCIWCLHIALNNYIES